MLLIRFRSSGVAVNGSANPRSRRDSGVLGSQLYPRIRNLSLGVVPRLMVCQYGEVASDRDVARAYRLQIATSRFKRRPGCVAFQRVGDESMPRFSECMIRVSGRGDVGSGSAAETGYLAAPVNRVRTVAMAVCNMSNTRNTSNGF